MKVAYLRVSTIEQSIERQKEAMKDLGIEKFYIEKKSGKNTERPELLNMIDFIREGDVVYIESFSRLARNTKDLIELVEAIQGKGASVVSLKEGFDLTTPAGRMMLSMMGALYQFELECMKERQLEGIAIAKKEGKYKGRKKIEITPAFVEAYKKYMNREITVTEAIEQLGIKSRTTWYKLVDEYKSQPNYKMPCSCHTCKKIVEDSEKIIAEDGRYLCLKCANKEESKKGDSGEWVVPAMKKLTRKITRDLGINILDKDCGASNINRTITDISIEYVFEYEGNTYMFEYLRNLDKIEVSILQK